MSYIFIWLIIYLTFIFICQDLVQQCKILESKLEENGYKDMEIEDHNNYDNTLNKLANKALTKSRTQLVSANSKRLNMYNQTKPKLGTYYAQGWSKNKVIIVFTFFH